MNNPYESPTLNQTKAAIFRPRKIDLFAWSYLMLTPLAVICTWLIGRVSLAHPIRIGFDHPRQIENLPMQISLWVTDFLCRTTLFVTIIALVCQLIIGHVKLGTRLTFAGLTIVGFIAMFGVFLWDPLNAWSWYNS